MACDYRIFQLGTVALQQGGELLDAQLAYQTWGELNIRRDNAVLIPTYYTGTHHSNEAFFGPGRAIDTERYFVVSPNMFGNGLSSSPSNTQGAQAGAGFPRISIYDNVQCQHRLLTEQLGIRGIALATGWSMAALQVYAFAALYPQMVSSLLPFCGSARCSVHNRVFLDGVKSALQADPVWSEGNYSDPPVDGLKAFARVYCGWAYSQTFFREHEYRELGFANDEQLLLDWEADHLVWDANDLLAKLATWQVADIAAHERFAGDFSAAMASISARTLVMPCATDLYFPPEDSALEVAAMQNAQLRIIESSWGHCSASPGRNPAVMQQLEDAFAELLA